MARSESETRARSPRRRRRWWVLLAAALGLWIVSGFQRLDPEGEFAVVELVPFGAAIRVDATWSLAPPGLFRLTRYPKSGVEIPLPRAEEAMLQAADGIRYGLRGFTTLRVRSEAWRELHSISGGEGLRGVLRHSVRRVAADLRPGSVHGPVSPTYRRELERGLRARLETLGVELRRLDLESFDYLSADPANGLGSTEARVLLIGLDGADWEIIDPLLDAGRLPNLGRLIDNGVRAKLLSISPLLSPVIWTSVATGVEPRRHGILDFLVADPGDGSRQPVTSVQRQAPTVWEILSRSGVDVGVVAWWASWPADPVRGYQISDRLAYQLFGFAADPDDSTGKSWPPELYDEVRPLIVTPDTIGWERVQPYLSGARIAPEQFSTDERKMIDELKTLIASGETYLEVALALRERFDPRLEVVYLEGTDTIGHLFMRYRLPQMPGVAPERVASFSEMVDRYYETTDEQLGRLLEGRGEEWTVMIVSDHGFASDATRPQTTDSRIGHGAAADWHRRFGILVLSGANVRPGATIDEASIYDVAPTLLTLFGQPVPRSWPGRVLGRALSPELLERRPVRFRDDDPQRGDQAAGRDGLIDPAAAEMIEKLQNLGYISSGADGSSESMTARNNAGVALLGEGRYAEAEAEFRAGLVDSPEAPMLRFNLGLALRFQGKTDEAQELFAATLDHPTTMRMAGHMLAQLRLAEGDHEEAERLLRQVLEREPGAAEVRNALGLTLERAGESEAAEAEYRHAAELDPDTALPRNNLGSLARQRGDLASASEWYLRAIEADPYFMGSYNNLALVYQEQGKMEQAIDLYNSALNKAPDNAVVLNNLASLYYATGDSDEARALWHRAVAADPRYPSPLNNLASLEINDRRYGEAERLLQAALRLDEDYGDARINLALVHRARGETEAAREELMRATADPRAAANSWSQLGVFELENGFVDAAIVALEKATAITPRSAVVWNALGEAYRLSGRTDRALAAWKRSLAIDPGQDNVRRGVAALQAPNE